MDTTKQWRITYPGFWLGRVHRFVNSLGLGGVHSLIYFSFFLLLLIILHKKFFLGEVHLWGGTPVPPSKYATATKVKNFTIR